MPVGRTRVSTPRLRFPRAVPPGGTIGIAAPAGPIDEERLHAGIALWQEVGFHVRWRPDVLARRGYLAGDDARRAAELMALVNDPEIDAIVCARGGYGCHRIVARLDPVRVRTAAKPLVGYSDVTTLLLWQRRRAGLAGFHGPMLERGHEQDEEAFRGLVAQLLGRGPVRLRMQGRAALAGRVEGPLVGGSLTTLVASLGTPWEIDLRDAIFCFEEVNEPPYRIDRLLEQLRAAGTLDRVAGFAVGQLVDCTHARYPEPTARDLILEKLEGLGRPVVTDLPFGHAQPNFGWPLGARARVDGRRGTLEILQRGVVPRR